MGHPVIVEPCARPSGARMMVPTVHELRRRGARLGCVSISAGGGMGMAMVVEAR
jgi:acetyl-CoA C-acetyltransferase